MRTAPPRFRYRFPLAVGAIKLREVAGNALINPHRGKFISGCTAEQLDDKALLKPRQIVPANCCGHHRGAPLIGTFVTQRLKRVEVTATAMMPARTDSRQWG
jgi:hypothetical protein